MAEISQFNPIDGERDLVIPSSQTDSNNTDLAGARLVGLIFPSAFTGTKILFKGSINGIDFFNLFNTNGVLLEINFIGDGFIMLFPADFAALRHLIIKSDAAEGADRTIKILTRPI